MQLTLGQIESLFTVPGLAAAGAVAVAVPVIIHLLSRFRRKAQAWGAMRFVWEALQRQRRRLQMEQWLLLLVRCLVVLVLGLALAGPVLTGCTDQLRSAGLLRGTPRSVHLVIDDGLSTQARQSGPSLRSGSASGEARFEALRAAALRIVDGLGPGDRVRVWRASQPVGEVSSSEAEPRSFASLRAGVRGEIEGLRPRDSGAALDDALAQVAEALQAEQDRANTAVVVLSDFSRHDVRPAVDRGLAAMPASVRLYVPRPATSAANVQIASLQPWRRAIVVTHDRQATVPVELTLRRFDALDAGGEQPLVVTLLDSRGRSVGETQRAVTWSAGQDAQALTLDVPIDPSALAGDADERVGLVVRAVLEGSASDALGADDVRLGTVEVRRGVRVALVSEAGGASSGDALEPGAWLRLALAPEGEDGSVRVTPMTPGELIAADADRLGEFDALVLARPELVSDSAWQRLARFVERGGLLWVFPARGDEPQMWPRVLRSVFSVDWQVGIEPIGVGAERGAALSVDALPPEALSLLRTDWEALLRPVRVARWLPLWTPEADAWLRLARDDRRSGDAAGTAQAVPAVLARHEHGRGTVLVSGVALDAGWTNLPTKPLFVPLVHEALRGLIGRGSASRSVVAGETPVLGDTWPDGLRALEPVPLGLGDEAPARLAVEADAAGLTVRDAVKRAGAYADPTAATPAKLVVNVEAPAGDTTAVDEPQLAAWLDAWGPWTFLDLQNPTTALQAVDGVRPNLAWPLLWLLLALVLLETVMARTFSHAKALQHRGLTAIVLERMRRFHLAHQPPEPKRETTRGRAA